MIIILANLEHFKKYIQEALQLVPKSSGAAKKPAPRSALMAQIKLKS
jgi:hypothetical protein